MKSLCVCVASRLFFSPKADSHTRRRRRGCSPLFFYVMMMRASPTSQWMAILSLQQSIPILQNEHWILWNLPTEKERKEGLLKWAKGREILLPTLFFFNETVCVEWVTKIMMMMAGPWSSSLNGMWNERQQQRREKKVMPCILIIVVFFAALTPRKRRSVQRWWWWCQCLIDIIIMLGCWCLSLLFCSHSLGGEEKKRNWDSCAFHN